MARTSLLATSRSGLRRLADARREDRRKTEGARSSRVRAGLAVLWLGLAVLGTGCTREPAPPFDSFWGRAASSGSVVFVPGHSLMPVKRGDEQRLLLTGVGHAWLDVEQTPAERVPVVLERPDEAARWAALVSQDAGTASPEARTEVKAVTDSGIDLRLAGASLGPPEQRAEGLVWWIEPENLPPGRHRLELRATESSGSVELSRIYLGGAEGALFSVAGSPESKYLADLYEYGVTGSFGQFKLGGGVFVGPQTRTYDLGTDAGGKLSFRVQNSTHGPGTFRVVAGRVEPADAPVAGRPRAEATLEAHARSDLDLTIPPGEREVTLSTYGDVGFYLWGLPTFQPADRPRPPHILLLTLDTVRRDALGVYGGPEGLTPHLDALAAEATTYTNAWTTAPWTLPSHASMFTGRYPSGHRAGVGLGRLDAGADTIARRLGQAGYASIGFAGGTFAGHRFGVAQGFGLYHSPLTFETPGQGLTALSSGVYSRWVDDPSFVFVNYFDAHHPYRLHDDNPWSARARAALDRLPDDDPWALLFSEGGSRWDDLVASRLPESAIGLEALRDAYWGEVHEVDRQVGALFAALRAAGLWDRTMILVTTDHGELLGEGGLFTHSHRLAPELMAVPLLVRRPGQTEARRVDELASVVDVFSTLVAAAGGADRHGDSVSLDPSLLSRRQQVLFEEHEAPHHPLLAPLRVASDLWGSQTRDQRLLTWDGEVHCSELSEDSSQVEQLVTRRGSGDAWRAADCEPVLRDRALQAIDGLRAQADSGPVAIVPLDPEERARLEALGYLR